MNVLYPLSLHLPPIIVVVLVIVEDNVLAPVTATDMFLLAGPTARTSLPLLKATLLTVALWRKLSLEANMLSGAQRWRHVTN